MSRAIINGYGALEMKMCYQRNMLLGNLFSFSLVAIIFSAFYIYSFFKPEPVVIDTDGPILIESVFEIPPQRSFEMEGNEGKIRQIKEKLGEWRGDNFILVDDDDFVDVDFTLPTRDEKRLLVDQAYTGGLDGDEPGIVIDLPDTPVEYPEMNEFVYHEFPPEMIYEEKPVYPRLARKAGMEGSVWIKALVDEKGNVIRAVVFKSSGSSAGFDEAAVAAAYKCKYKPALQNGFPIPVWVTYKVEFLLRQ